MTPQQPEAGPAPVIRFESGPRLLLADELAQIRAAMEDFLNSRWQELAAVVPPDLQEAVPRRAGEPFLGSQGELRYGEWIVDAAGQQLRASHRPLPPGTYQVVLFLDETQPRHWRVVRPSFQKVLPRR